MGLNINITYDSSVNSAPAGFKSAVAAATAAYESLFSDPITINIQVGYGEIDGQSLGGGALGESLSYQSAYSYAQVRNALAADATSTTDRTALASLPNSDPANGVQYFATTAEAKALGLMGSSGSVDGYVGFSSSMPLSYGQLTSAGSFDFTGVVEHEISEVMGRVSEVSSSLGNALSVLDLFRYSAPAVRQLIGGQSAYFSIDGGRTNLDNFNTDPSGDYGDWAASAGNDAFLAMSGPGVTNALSQADITVMDTLGYDAVSAASPTAPVNPTPTPPGPQVASTVANAIAAYSANPGMAAVSIADSAANVSANLDALQVLASASKLTAISLTGSNMGLSTTAQQLQNDAGVLAAIISNYTMTVSGVSAGTAASIAALPHVTSISLSDTAANVGAQLDGLQTLAAGGKLSAITLTDSGPATLTLSATQFRSDGSVLSKIGSVYTLAISAVPASLAASIATQPHVASVVVSDSAANVTANLAGLQTLAASNKLSAITLTGTGVQSLSVTAAQFTADAAALHAISTPYTLNVTGMTVAAANAAVGNPQVASVSVSDTAANVSAGLDSLQQLASQHKLTSISLTTPATAISNYYYYYYYYYAAPAVPVLAVTAAQLSQDGLAISAITSNYTMTVSGVSAATAASIAALPHVTSISLSDTAANVGAQLDGLQSLAAGGKISSVILTDSGPATLTLSATQFRSDGSVLSKIGSVYNLAISAVPASLAASTAAQPHVASIAVSDSAANVTANLAGLQTLAASNKLSAITLTGTGVQSLSVTAAQFAADAAALHAISTPYTLNVTGMTVAAANTAVGNPQVASVSVSDTAANVSAGLDSLQQLASQHKLTSISLTAPAAAISNYYYYYYYYYNYYAAPVVPVLAVTAAQLSQDGLAISAITSNYTMTVSGVSAVMAASTAALPHVTSISLSDNAANIGAQLDGLQSLAATGKLSSVTLTDSGTATLALTATQFKSDGSVLSKIGSVYNLAVNAVSAGLAASTAAQPHVASVAVSDSAADVTANMAGLQTLVANGKLSSIALTDVGVPTLKLTALQQQADAGVLADIITPFSVQIAGTSSAASVMNFVSAVSSFAPAPAFSSPSYQPTQPAANGTGILAAHPLA